MRLQLTALDILLDLLLALAYTITFLVFEPYLKPEDEFTLVWLMFASWLTVFIAQLAIRMVSEQ